MSLLACNAIPGWSDPVDADMEGSSSAVELTPRAERQNDPCFATEIAASPSRPVWTAGAATTQCNVLEFDAGWLLTPMGDRVNQTLLPTSVRYGLTPRMDLRWGMPGPIRQGGGDSAQLRGITDQTFSVTYRFVEGSRRVPALAVSYGLKDPHANPAKGFGTGFVDHQLSLIASRDLGRLHFDFNAVGTMAGCAKDRDGGVFFGMAMSRPVTRSLTWLVESEGGTQPGTEDRYGAALSGVSWTIRPWLVADAAYTRAYTAGAPRSQITAGFTYARRSGFPPLARGSRVARWLGR
ncbi:MAG TPA: hypothetical protein VHZ28_02040 [Terracidiphilus sp.]|nr:hypothetical protein [Terracidiphilus sp.]